MGDVLIQSVRRIVTIPLLILVLIGCSAVEWGYRRLDWIMEWYIEKFVPLNREQSKQLASDLDRFLNWHCGTQVVRYAHWFAARGEESARGFTFEAFVHASDEMLSFLRDITQKLVPPAVTLAHSVSAAQIVEIQKRFEASNQELSDYYEENTDSERREEYTSRLTRILTRWLGSLTPVQKESIAQWTQAFQLAGQDRINARRAWQTALLGILRERDEAMRTAGLEKLMLSPQQFWTPEFVAKIDQNRRLTLELLADIGMTLTPAQREHFAGHAKEWNEDMLALQCSYENPAVAAVGHTSFLLTDVTHDFFIIRSGALGRETPKVIF